MRVRIAASFDEPTGTATCNAADPENAARAIIDPVLDDDARTDRGRDATPPPSLLDETARDPDPKADRQEDSRFRRL